MLASTHLILPSTSSSSSSSTTSKPSAPLSPSFLARLLLRRKQPDMSSSASSSATETQPQQVRIVHRPAAPALGPLSRPHSDWRSERAPREEFRGRSGRRRGLNFDMPTTAAPIPIPYLRRSLSHSSSSSISSQSIPNDSSPSASRDASLAFVPSSPPAYSDHAPISLHSIQVRIAAARSNSSRSTGSYDSSAYFDDRSDEEIEEDELDSSASSSAFSFIDGEEMEGIEEQQQVAVRRPSDGDVVMMEDASSSLNDIHHLHFARKPIPSSLLNSPSSNHPFASLPPAPALFGIGHEASSELAFLSRQAQAKGAQRKSAVRGWMVSGGVSL